MTGAERVHVGADARARASLTGDHPFAAYPPPFDLVSDMLIAAGTCAAAPLREAFPGLPFARVGGRAFLVVWFARVHDIGFDAGGSGSRRASHEAPAEVPYDEIDVAVLLRSGGAFVPGIYATRPLPRRLGHGYGMPKRPMHGRFEETGQVVSIRAEVHGQRTRLRARTIGHGGGLARLTAARLPTWSPRVTFPGGSWIRARVEGADRVRFAWLTQRRLAVGEPWLPRPVHLWPVALHVRGLRMRLPAPPPPGSEVGA